MTPACNLAEHQGTVYFNLTQNRLEVCYDTGGGVYGWGAISAGSSNVWTKSSDFVYPADTLANQDIYIGIGTTTPQNKLHIVSTAAGYEGITLSGANLRLKFDETDVGSAIFFGKPGNEDRISISGTDDDNLIIGFNGVTAIGGKVGIGADPLAPLYLANSSFRIDDAPAGMAYSLYLERKNNHGDAWIIHNARYDSGNDVLRTVNGHGSFGTRGIRFNYGEGIYFFTDGNPTIANALVTPAYRMTIRNDGKVGIGTTGPLSMLHIKDAGTFPNGPNILVEGNSTPSASPRIGLVDIWSTGNVNTAPAWFIDNKTDQFRIFRQQDMFTPGTERLTIDSGGSMRINADVRVTGSIRNALIDPNTGISRIQILQSGPGGCESLGYPACPVNWSSLAAWQTAYPGGCCGQCNRYRMCVQD